MNFLMNVGCFPRHWSSYSNFITKLNWLIYWRQIKMSFLLFWPDLSNTYLSNMQILPRSKKYLYLSNGNKHFLIALSTRRFIFLMKQLSIIWVIYSQWKKVFDDQNLTLMNVKSEYLITPKNEEYKDNLKTIKITIIIRNTKHCKVNQKSL